MEQSLQCRYSSHIQITTHQTSNSPKLNARESIIFKWNSRSNFLNKSNVLETVNRKNKWTLKCRRNLKHKEECDYKKLGKFYLNHSQN